MFFTNFDKVTIKMFFRKQSFTKLPWLLIDFKIKVETKPNSQKENNTLEGLEGIKRK